MYEYGYSYRFWVDDDIIHRYSCFNIRHDIKFLFGTRTNFRVKGKDCCDCDEIIDTERFEIGAENSDRRKLLGLYWTRLGDYWFSDEQMSKFAQEASAFAAAIEPARRRVIPIAVEMDVRTVRLAGETLAEAKDRAMRSEKIFPLFLMYNRNAFANMKKSRYHDLALFLRMANVGTVDFETMRVFEEEAYYNKFMVMCSVCGRAPKTGDQIAILDNRNFCGHAFHFHCLIRSMLTDTNCPRCSCALSSKINGRNSIFCKYSFI